MWTSTTDRTGTVLSQPSRSVRFLVDRSIESFALLPDGRYTIGRGSSAHFQIGHRSMSRTHAELGLDAHGLRLSDLGSSNGTSIGARTLKPGEVARLAVGEPFFVGKVLGVVHEAPAPARASIALGRESLVALVDQLLAQRNVDGTASPFLLATFRGAGVADHLQAMSALLPPAATVIVTSDRSVSAVVPGASDARMTSLLELIARATAGENPVQGVALRLKTYPGDGETRGALLPEDLDEDDEAHTAHTRELRTNDLPKSPEMAAIEALIEQVAATPASVLILGETGVGKEVTARRIHDRSDRARGPFVALNCAALSETLLESELFGHEKGAFTGALTTKPGLIETASGGTLLLDELGEMPLGTQAKLLRVLEERAVMRVGSVKSRPVDVRIIAATNRDLLEAIREKQFRADIYYRLNSIVLRLPPLRQRRSEILPLAQMFATRAAELLRRPAAKFSPTVVERLEAYDWPGNIRELRNVVDRLVVLAADGHLKVAHLPEEILAARRPNETAPAVVSVAPPPAPFVESAPTDMPTLPPPVAAGSIDDRMAQVERKLIQDALEAAGGNQTRAAKALGITRRALIGRIEKYGLPRPRD